MVAAADPRRRLLGRGHHDQHGHPPSRSSTPTARACRDGVSFAALLGSAATAEVKIGGTVVQSSTWTWVPSAARGPASSAGRPSAR